MPTSAVRPVILVSDFGAIPDGATVNTAAIQAALDAAHAQGGGVVMVPPGRWVTGTLRLQSHVTLDLAANATLIASPNIADYPPLNPKMGDRHPHHLLYAHHCRNIALTGLGTIDGSGPSFWYPSEGPRVWIQPRQPRVSPMIEIRNCQRVHMRDIRITNSPGWTVQMFQCNDVWIRGVHIVNDLFGPNTDGFCLNGCHDVFVSDCHIECGDDAIVIKTTQDSRNCERINVSGCILRSNCAALKCGTEAYYDYRDIVFADCIIHQSNRAVALYCLDGASIDGVHVSNLICDTNSGFVLNRPLSLDVRKRYAPGQTVSDPYYAAVDHAGTIRNVRMSNIVARTDGRILLTAADGGIAENIFLDRIHLVYPLLDNPLPAAAESHSNQFAEHSPDARAAAAAVVAENISNLRVSGLTVEWPRQGSDRGWFPGPLAANGSYRQYSGRPPAAPVSEFSAFWGRGLRGGVFDGSGLHASGPGRPDFDVQGSDIRIVT